MILERSSSMLQRLKINAENHRSGSQKRRVRSRVSRRPILGFSTGTLQLSVRGGACPQRVAEEPGPLRSGWSKVGVTVARLFGREGAAGRRDPWRR